MALGLLIFVASIGSFYLLPLGLHAAGGHGPARCSHRAAAGLAPRRHHAPSPTPSRAASASAPTCSSVFVNGGTRAWARGAEVRKATLIINLVPKERAQAQPGRDQGRDRPRAWPACPTSASGSCKDNGQRQLQLVVAGRDGAAVTHAAAELTSQAKRIPLLANVVSTRRARPARAARACPITDIAADLGVSTEAISETVRIATIGDVDANLAKFDVGDRQVPIRVQLDEKARARSGSCSRR